MSNEIGKKILWWVSLFIAPLILVGIELFHPAGFTNDPGMYEYLSIPQPHIPQHKALYYFGPQWWFTLHMIQTPLVCLVAVGLWLMVDSGDHDKGLITTISAWASRILTFIFIIYYTVLDSIGGIGLGKTIEITEDLVNKKMLTDEQLEGVKLLLSKTWSDSWIGGVGSFISQTGSWAIFFAAILTAITLFLMRKAPWQPLVILIAFGWEIQLSHASYHGPIAFSLLIISAAWIYLKSDIKSNKTNAEEI
jgi:hypothetical protein